MTNQSVKGCVVHTNAESHLRGFIVPAFKGTIRVLVPKYMGVNSRLKIREEQSYQDLKHVDSGVERKNLRKLPFGDIHTISTAYILYTETDSCISKLSGAGCTVCIRVL